MNWAFLNFHPKNLLAVLPSSGLSSAWRLVYRAVYMYSPSMQYAKKINYIY